MEKIGGVDIVQNRQQHQPEVKAFLSNRFGKAYWDFDLPHGRGNETYLVRSDHLTCFVKLNAQTSRYQAMASLGLTPPLLAEGILDDGISIIVQPLIPGRNPTWSDYRIHLQQIAEIIRQMHHSPEVKQALPPTASDRYSDAGLAALNGIRLRWMNYRSLVPDVAAFVDGSLESLAQIINQFDGEGLVASHNDICNANWLITPEGQIYLVDLESMSLDDPALDIGATLWWYYPPALRRSFLMFAGYDGNQAFQLRMQMRMTMHCLHIILPREGSFDAFEPSSFTDALTDFRAILSGEENPHGYEDF